MQGTAAAPLRNPSDRVAAALVLRAEGRFAEALELLNLPGEYSQDGYTLKGDLQLELGRVHEALGSFSTVIALDRRSMYAHQKLAVCLRRLGRWETAVETLKKILAQDAYCDAARLGLGDCFLNLNRPAEALASFEGCWSESSRPSCLFGKAVSLQLLRRFDQAEKMYLSFLELKTESPDEALSNLIAMCMEQSLFSQAQRYAMQLLGTRPDSRIALQALLVTCFERREFESAADYYRRLQALPAVKVPAGKSHAGIQYRLSPEDAEKLAQYVPLPARRTADPSKGNLWPV